MKKLLSILLALVLATGLFAACSGSGSGSQAAGSTASGSGAAAAPDGKKTDLLLWLPPFAAGDDGALDKEFWTETLAPWAAENNVDLTIEITPWGNYEEKYLTGFSSGEGPDVGYMYLEMFNDFIEMGALEPLDAYITDADRENYLYLDKGFIKGKQYTMPFIVGNARILYFNMDILEQAGVTELPATWQDLVDVAVKIKEAGLPGVMPFAGEWADPAIGALNNLYYPYLWQAGGDIYNEDGTKVALMDNDAAVKAARFLYDLATAVRGRFLISLFRRALSYDLIKGKLLTWLHDSSVDSLGRELHVRISLLVGGSLRRKRRKSLILLLRVCCGKLRLALIDLSLDHSVIIAACSRLHKILYKLLLVHSLARSSVRKQELICRSVILGDRTVLCLHIPLRRRVRRCLCRSGLQILRVFNREGILPLCLSRADPI